MKAAIVGSMIAAFAMGTACAQDYPSRPIRIVTAAAGGGSDFTSRLLAQGLTVPLGQPVIVDNRPSGVIAAELVGKAPPDAHTLLVAGESLWVLPLVQKVPYDVKDLAPIALVTRETRILAVHPSVAANSVSELVAFAKARPGQLNYASSGARTTTHLSGELFKALAGVDIVHVPSKGSAPAITALISGEVQLIIADIGLLMPHMKSGRARGLAVTSAEPSTLAPGLPTITGAGVPGFEATGMTGVFAPIKAATANITRLNQEIVRIMNRTDVRERFSNASVEAVTSSPEQLAGILKVEITKWGKVIKDAGIKAD